MPRIPQYTSSGVNQPRVDVTGVASPTIRAGVNMANAVTNFGKTVVDTAQAFEAEEQRREADHLTIKARADLAEFREGLNERTDYSNFDAEYKEFRDQWQKTHTEGISDYQRDILGTRLETVFADGERGVRARSREIQIDVSRSQLVEEGDAALKSYMMAETADEQDAAEDEYFAAIDGRVETGVITAEAAVKAKQSFRSEADTAVATRMMQDNPAALAEGLEDAEFLPDLDPTQRIKIKDRADAEVEKLAEKAATDLVVDGALEAYETGGRDAATDYLDRLASDTSLIPDNARRARAISLASTLVNAADATEADERAKKHSDLSIAVSRGDAGHADIDAAYKSDDITAAQRTTLTLAADRVQADRNEAATRRRLGAGFYDGTAVLDPSNADHRKAADEHFAGMMNDWIAEGVSPADMAGKVTDYVKRTSYVPTELKNRLTGSLRSETNDTAVLGAAEMVRDLTEASPIAVQTLPDEVLERAEMVNRALSAGETEKEAVRLMRERLHPKNKEVRELAKTEIKAEKYAKDYPDWAREAFEDSWFSTPEFNSRRDRAAIVSDFAFNFEATFERTGDKDVAKDVAGKKMRAKWGVTEVDGGSRLIAYPPEKVYAETLSFLPNLADHIKTDLEDVVRGLGHEGDYQLVSDDRTRAGAQHGRPTYGIMLKNESGDFVPALREDGTLARWGMDVDRERVEFETVMDMTPKAVFRGPRRDRAGNIVVPKTPEDYEAEARALDRKRREIKADVKGVSAEQRSLIDRYQGKR